ncbi:50S ribosomal protein L10 [bacterium]|nr:MAG: 50S ribosomal protein L10 [bacterium]
MLKKQQKKEIVTKLAEELKAAKGVVFSDFVGLPARDIQALRTVLGGEGVKHKVVKLTLLKRALKAAGVDVANFNFSQALATSWSAADEVAPARLVSNFARTNDRLKVIAGIFENKLVDAKTVKALASLPGKQDLRAQLVYTIASPLRGLVGVLSGNMRQFVNVLKAVADKQAV